MRVNNVNQQKHSLKVYATEKEMIYLNDTLKVSASRNKEYISEIYKTPLAVPYFSNVAGES